MEKVMEFKVTICALPHRERHVAEISLFSDTSPQVGYDSISHPIGEVTIENDQLEFEIYINEENAPRSFDCKEFIKALDEGMSRLLEMYPQ